MTDSGQDDPDEEPDYSGPGEKAIAANLARIRALNDSRYGPPRALRGPDPDETEDDHA